MAQPGADGQGARAAQHGRHRRRARRAVRRDRRARRRAAAHLHRLHRAVRRGRDRVLQRLAVEAAGLHPAGAERVQRVAGARAHRRRRPDHAVERSDCGVRDGRRGARGWQLSCPQASRADTDGGRTDGRGRPRRRASTRGLQRRAGHRQRRRPGARRTPRGRCDLVHRLRRHGKRDPGSSSQGRQTCVARTGRQEPIHRVPRR